MISFLRIDNRLVHGQVIEGWLPHLRVRRIVVVDQEAAKNPLVRASMGLAVPSEVQLQIAQDESELATVAQDAVPTLVLMRDVRVAFDAHEHGLQFQRLNLGNIHFRNGRRTISASVFLSEAELEELRTLAATGVEVQAQALPSDRALGLAEIDQRFQSAPGP